MSRAQLTAGRLGCGVQIASAIEAAVGCKGALVVVEGLHMCMVARGVEKHASSTTTVAARGLSSLSPQLFPFILRHLLGRLSATTAVCIHVRSQHPWSVSPSASGIIECYRCRFTTRKLQVVAKLSARCLIFCLKCSQVCPDRIALMREVTPLAMRCAGTLAANGAARTQLLLSLCIN